MMAGRDLSAELFDDVAPPAAPAARAGAGRDLSADLFGPSTSKPAAAPLSRLDKVVKGVRDPIDAGAQLLTHLLPDSVVRAGNRLNNIIADKTGLVGRVDEGGLGDLVAGGNGASGVDKMVRDAEVQYQARRAAGGEAGFDGYRTIGNLVSPANLAIASRLPAAASLAGRVGMGAVGGAASGALTPVASGDFASEKAKQIGAGALVGGAIPAVAGGLGRIVSPNASKNADLQLLKSAGVRPTIGQTLGGAANRLEERATSVPILGDAITAARKRSLEDFNKAAIERAAGKVGAKVDDIGQDGVRQAGDKISAAYEDALGQISGVRLDGSFGRDLMQLRGMAQGLTTDMRNKFNKVIKETIGRKGSTGSILPDDYKAVDSDLGKLAADYGGSSTASEREFGSAVLQLQSLLKQQMLRSNPKVADKLKEADSAWANLVRVEGAAKSAKNADGVFTPAQLNMAIQGADKSVRKRAVARGTALMQDLGNAGQNVLGNRYPDSGTAGRLLLNGGALGLGSAVSPGALIGLGVGAGLYTSPAQRALVALASSRKPGAEKAAELLRQSAPYALGASGQLGLGLLGN
ncbi:hypothetical protein [Pseudoduganella chitinolytica]|uniref:Injection protein n=1 Tax=Pseudoduganella chitinolytica TaxID=34070 RepID=A0ABY8BJI5_9BURK|nr:hypothetical protein [Pseudoduganella chitinolytica]WEF34852.1 hypothetical protein PX653_08850 [Pseudoduganella chitinolytica]